MALATAGFFLCLGMLIGGFELSLLIPTTLLALLAFVLCSVYATIAKYAHVSGKRAYKYVAWVVAIPFGWSLTWFGMGLLVEYRFPEQIGTSPFYTKSSLDFVVLSGIMAIVPLVLSSMLVWATMGAKPGSFHATGTAASQTGQGVATVPPPSELPGRQQLRRHCPICGADFSEPTSAVERKRFDAGLCPRCGGKLA